MRVRRIEPEWLDHLPPQDPQAVASRKDLRWFNRLMGHRAQVTRVCRSVWGPRMQAVSGRPLRLLELGGGDGCFLLALARRWQPFGVTAEVRLVDQFDLLAPSTRAELADLGWRVEVCAKDVFEALEEAMPRQDLMLTTLFLHHFPEDRLRLMGERLAELTDLFIACEPRRNRVSWLATRLLGVAGCNRVTRNDAPVSVKAGFRDQELSGLWPAVADWKLREYRAGLFSHCFVAHRHG